MADALFFLRALAKTHVSRSSLCFVGVEACQCLYQFEKRMLMFKPNQTTHIKNDRFFQKRFPGGRSGVLVGVRWRSVPRCAVRRPMSSRSCLSLLPSGPCPGSTEPRVFQVGFSAPVQGSGRVPLRVGLLLYALSAGRRRSAAARAEAAMAPYSRPAAGSCRSRGRRRSQPPQLLPGERCPCGAARARAGGGGAAGRPCPRPRDSAAGALQGARGGPGGSGRGASAHASAARLSGVPQPAGGAVAALPGAPRFRSAEGALPAGPAERRRHAHREVLLLLGAHLPGPRRHVCAQRLQGTARGGRRGWRRSAAAPGAGARSPSQPARRACPSGGRSRPPALARPDGGRPEGTRPAGPRFSPPTRAFPSSRGSVAGAAKGAPGPVPSSLGRGGSSAGAARGVRRCRAFAALVDSPRGTRYRSDSVVWQLSWLSASAWAELFVFGFY